MNTATRIRALFAFSLCIGWLGSTAIAHEDMLVQRTDPNGSNRLLTGTVDLDALETTIPVRVFEAELDFDAPAFEFSGDDPGFNAFSDASPLKPAGTFALPGNTNLRFEIQPFEIASQTADLFYWDGLGGVDFSPAVATTLLSVAGATANDPLADKTGTIDVTGANGAIHRHHDFVLSSTLVDTPPDEGVYLLQMILQMDGVSDSAPFWLVFGTEETSHESHEAAVDWVQANLVPEPASLTFALLGCVGLTIGQRRQRRPSNRGSTV